MAVDRATLAVTRDRRAYAAALLAFSDPPKPLLAATPLIGRRYITQRIACITEESSMSRLRTGLGLTFAATTVVIATTVAAAYVPVMATLHEHAAYLPGAPLITAQDGRVYKSSEGVSLPQVVREVKPSYTPDAMRAKIQGSVWLSVVVLSSGDVGTVTVTKSLDEKFGLDDEAVKAARQWKFKPGTKDGKPVAVEVTIELTFTLKK